MLFTEFLQPLNITEQALSDSLHVPYETINDIVHGRSTITPSIALRLATFFTNSADFWMNMQLRWDFFLVQQAEKDILDAIQPFCPEPEHIAGSFPDR
jgi:addiction module HigA family antidote